MIRKLLCNRTDDDDEYEIKTKNDEKTIPIIDDYEIDIKTGNETLKMAYDENNIYEK
jgi:hypothetical protein